MTPQGNRFSINNERTGNNKEYSITTGMKTKDKKPLIAILASVNNHTHIMLNELVPSSSNSWKITSLPRLTSSVTSVKAFSSHHSTTSCRMLHVLYSSASRLYSPTLKCCMHLFIVILRRRACNTPGPHWSEILETLSCSLLGSTDMISGAVGRRRRESGEAREKGIGDDALLDHSGTPVVVVAGGFLMRSLLPLLLLQSNAIQLKSHTQHALGHASGCEC